MAPILVSEAASVGTEVGRVVATDPDLSRLLVYRLDYNRSDGRREDGALVSPADWQAGRGADPGGGEEVATLNTDKKDNQIFLIYN